jgi:hypothetical protein
VSLKAGQVIAGKYRLNALLGTGGMASVWSATNTFTERQFAIKFLLPTFAKTPEAAQRFLMEAKVSGRVQHPNIIEVLDVGQAEDGSLFLVMELLQGSSLEHAMRKQEPPMSLYEFIGVMLDVARALAAAHRGGVVHRDLKPSNILLHKDTRGVAVPKVLDFGVSKFLLETDRDNSLTIAGTVLGSPLYMSPEQAMGQLDIDHRTDVFAFGAILFEGLCGFRCFDAPNFNALIVMIATQQPKSIDQYAPQMPESVRALVRDCLVTDKNRRIESFDRIIERMTPLLAEPGRVADGPRGHSADARDHPPERSPAADGPRSAAHVGIGRALGGVAARLSPRFAPAHPPLRDRRRRVRVDDHRRDPRRRRREARALARRHGRRKDVPDDRAAAHDRNPLAVRVFVERRPRRQHRLAPDGYVVEAPRGQARDRRHASSVHDHRRRQVARHDTGLARRLVARVTLGALRDVLGHREDRERLGR